MADNDDKREAGSGQKRTLTLKGTPNVGRPGMSRSSRTVVVEKRTRVVPPRGSAPGSAPRPHPTQEQVATPRQPLRQQPSTTARPQLRPTGLNTSEADRRAQVLRQAEA
ncbi:MAG TPA: translation initiation factor IF-2, partial [Alphaproteobacteria bacterium]|nr:translation initiation factor IF-2 [Alphaproteobacteria bacterium]